MPYYKNITVNYPGPENVQTAKSIYWSQLQFPVTIKEFGAISYINFSLVEPYNFAVTSSAKIQVFSSATNKVYKRLSKFKETAYSGTFRQDGKLLVAGSEDSVVRLFDVKAKALLKTYTGHKRPVHRCCFSCDSNQIISFSDDKTCVLWDITNESVVSSFSGHSDYVRCGAANPFSSELFVSGSYDHFINGYDSRTNSSVFSMDHGAPVEDILYLPSGQLLVSCGGAEVRLWDVTANRLLARLSQHHKTVTCLCLANDGQTLMSGSLDRHVKVYELATLDVVHTLDYPSAILSLGVAPDSKVLSVGTADGLISVQHWKEASEPIGPQGARGDTGTERVTEERISATGQSEVIIKQETTTKLKVFEVLLKSFNHSAALDSVLVVKHRNSRKLGKRKYRAQDSVAMAVIQELIRRKHLRAALAGRSATKLRPVISLLRRKLHNVTYMRTVTDVINILLDLYAGEINQDEELSGMFRVLFDHVRQEVGQMEDMMALRGCTELMLNSKRAATRRRTQPLEILSVD